MTGTAKFPIKARPIWVAALILSLAGWALTVGRIAFLLFGNSPRPFDWRSLILDSGILFVTTALSLRSLGRDR